MRALVTGGHGFLGRSLVALLREQPGTETVAAPTRSEWNADVRDVVAQVWPDVVWHLAGRLGGTEEELRRDNEGSALELFEALRALDHKPRVILASSVAVYGTGGARDQPLDEEAIPRPRGIYADTKFAAEEHARRYSASGGDVIIARISNPIGPGMGDHLMCGTVASQIVDIERGMQPPVLNLRDLSPLRDFLHAADVAAALEHLFRQGRPGLVYNVASGRSMSVKQVVDLFLAEARVKSIEVNSTVREAGRSPMQEQWLSIARIASTGWTPARGIRDAAIELLESRRTA